MKTYTQLKTYDDGAAVKAMQVSVDLSYSSFLMYLLFHALLTQGLLRGRGRAQGLLSSEVGR